jgi:hypothetical protein
MSARVVGSRWTEWVLRAFALFVYGSAAKNLAAAWWADHSRTTRLLLLFSEGSLSSSS